MIPYRLIAYGVLAAAILGLGIYAKHIYSQSIRVPELEQTINDMRGQIEAEREQARIALEQEGELRKKLSVANADHADIARKLRRAFQADLSCGSSSPSVPDGAGGVGSGPGELDEALKRLISAGDANALRVRGWNEREARIPAEMKH